MRRLLRPFIFMSLSAVSIIASSRTTAGAKAIIDSGPLQGEERDGVTSFKGIPYAQPPVGDLRWRAPQPVSRWTRPRQATQFGADCMQKPFGSDAAPLGVKPAEDCLYINVWRPANVDADAAPLPVMVWIYGGGFVNGGSSPSVYDGSQFAKQGVVMVSFNYRLGRFGFFAHPALTHSIGESEPLGNYGYMDQIAALQWVKRNIRAFGGDPNGVTLFGESAGGASVLALMTSPLTKGLFNKAIIQSGGGRGALMPMRELHDDTPHLASAESVGVAFARAAGIRGNDAAALTKLRALPAESIVDGMNMSSMFNDTYVGGPIRDGKIVTDVPNAVIERGEQWKVPVMIGATSADIGIPQGKNRSALFATFGALSGRAKAVYDRSGKTSFDEISRQVASDRLMVEPARLIARLVSAQGLPAYEYRFSYVAQSMRREVPGAPHASELPYVFDTVQVRYGKKTTPDDEATAKAVLSYWVAFAKTGEPKAGHLPDWPMYTKENDALLDFTANGPVAGPDRWKGRLDVIEESSQ